MAELTARVHTITTMRLPDVELKVDYNQLANTTNYTTYMYYI